MSGTLSRNLKLLYTMYYSSNVQKLTDGQLLFCALQHVSVNFCGYKNTILVFEAERKVMIHVILLHVLKFSRGPIFAVFMDCLTAKIKYMK